jgi:hypothetical protein
MASITSLPGVLYDLVCAFISADDMIQAGSAHRYVDPTYMDDGCDDLAPSR